MDGYTARKMNKSGAATVLLLIAAMFLLMLAISGRFKAIFTAAFPSLGGNSTTSNVTTSNVTTPTVPAGAFNNATHLPFPLSGTGAVVPGTGQLAYNGLGQGMRFN